MTPGQVIVLISAVTVLCGAGVVAVIGGLLLWTVRHIQPIEALEAQIFGLRGLVEALDAQVTKLRTSKAGRVSNAKRTSQPEPEPEPEDPMLDGLSAEERSLFM